MKAKEMRARKLGREQAREREEKVQQAIEFEGRDMEAQ